ncbi:WRKY transcription factor 13 [Populus alba x Populus x berolinensis]|nr:WRKY transcription factor 13 [Populus alba x Populus x berolinensis]
MAATSQATLNQQPLFEDQEMPTQMGFFSFPPQYLTYPQSASCHQSLKGFIIPPSLAADAPSTTNLTETLLLSSATNKQREDTIASDFGGPHLLSLQRSSANLWAWGEVNECLNSKRSGSGGDHLGVSTIKMKKIKARRKVREPRFCFKTLSDVDVLDDGYKWRKYGQKVVKNTQHPRSYYRCTQDNCRVKKRVERLAEDPRMVITTYEGRHAHSPSHDLEESQTPSQFNNFFF